MHKPITFVSRDNGSTWPCRLFDLFSPLLNTLLELGSINCDVPRIRILGVLIDGTNQLPSDGYLGEYNQIETSSKMITSTRLLHFEASWDVCARI